METDPIKSNWLGLAVNWAALLVALAFVGFLAWYIPADRPAIEGILRDFNMPLPSSTELLLSIPDAAFWIAGAMVAAGLISAHWCARGRGSVGMLHMLVIVICCIVLMAYRETMLQPLMSLIRSISAPVQQPARL